VAVIIPAHNEAENLAGVLTALPRAALPELRAIVVDDGSTDGTGDVARALGAEIVIRHERNRGLGAALRTGIAAALQLDPRAAVYIDADGEYDPREMTALLAPIDDGRADYVLGSRFLGSRDGQPLARYIGNRFFTALLCVLAGRRISDGQTGFRAFSARALAVAEIVHDYNYAQVLTLDLLHKGMRMTEVPVTYRHRRRGRSFVTGAYLWRVPIGIARQLLSH
jgi:glycosyltransferase involved in cell wall biosynthesis